MRWFRRKAIRADRSFRTAERFFGFSIVELG